MKKLVSLALAALLGLALCACGSGKTPFDPEKTPQALFDAPGVFSEELEKLDRNIVDWLYGVKTESGVAEAVSWVSPGSTAEEVAVFRFESADAAEAFESAAWAHIDQAKEENETYRPLEMPKLDKAVVERRGATLLILVCDDPQAAQAVLG